jgi:hypothetical protein
VLLWVLWFFSMHSSAGDEPWLFSEVRGGVLEHDLDHSWAASSRESGVDTNLEVRFSSMAHWFNQPLIPAFGVSANSEGATSKAYLDFCWQVGGEKGLFLSVGIGGALQDGQSELTRSDRKALGSRMLFHIPAELGFYVNADVGLTLFFDHISNGNSNSSNEGLDTLGLRIIYRL